MTYERQYLLSDQEREERLRDRVRELEALHKTGVETIALACERAEKAEERVRELEVKGRELLAALPSRWRDLAAAQALADALRPTASASEPKSCWNCGDVGGRHTKDCRGAQQTSGAGRSASLGEKTEDPMTDCHTTPARGPEEAGPLGDRDSKPENIPFASAFYEAPRPSEEVWTENEIAKVKADAKELEAVLGPDPTKVGCPSEARICVYCGNPYGNGHSNRCAVTRLGWEESWSSSMHRPADASEVAQARVDEILAAHTPEPTGKRHLEPRPAEPVPDEFWRTQLDARERIGYLRGRQEATAELARDAMAQRPNEALNDRRDPNGQVHADGSSRGSGDPNHGRGGLVSADPGQRVDDARALPREHGQADGQRLDQVDGGPVASAGRLDGAIDRPDYPRSTCRHDREATVSVIDPRALGASAMVRQDLARWCGACGAFFYGGRWQAPQPRSETPIPMILYCPECSSIHVDEGEWTTRPHKTHQCQTCWNEWRPANVPTVGVKALETGGTGGGA